MELQIANNSTRPPKFLSADETTKVITASPEPEITKTQARSYAIKKHQNVIGLVDWKATGEKREEAVRDLNGFLVDDSKITSEALCEATSWRVALVQK